VEVLSDQSVCRLDLVVIRLAACCADDFPRIERHVVLAGALRSGHGQRTAVAFYGIAFDVTALTFNAVWQYARRHRVLSDALDAAGATAAFNAFYWLPIRGESPRPRPS
jgi:hypothetical protein